MPAAAAAAAVAGAEGLGTGKVLTQWTAAPS